MTAHPILSTVEAVISRLRHVRIDIDKILEIAGWMAYEELAWPDFFSPLNPPGEVDTLDFIFLHSTINFAFTDFRSHRIFEVDYKGAVRSDTDAMVACLSRAMGEGVPILEGEYLAAVSRTDLEKIFEGTIEMPMLDERVEIFNEVGRTLVEHHNGRFHHFVEAGPPRLYADGRGQLERLVRDFPSFRDTSPYRGQRVTLNKRAQLVWWILHATFRRSGFFRIEDAHLMTAFADYIVPMALRLLGILVYEPALDAAIESHALLPRDSEEEVEIRAATLWAVHLLTREINRLRPAERQVIEPLIDARLWTHFHATHHPHHLTVTTAY